MIENKIKEQKHIKKLLLWTLVFLNFFDIILLNFNIINYILLFIILFFSYKSRKVSFPYKKTIFVYTFFIICSCIYSHYYNGQIMYKVLFNSYDYLTLLFALIVMKYNLSSHQLIQTIKIVSIIFCCCYLIQWIIYPIQLFAGSLNENTITQNQFRMRMPGSICAFTLFFYGINQFLLNRKKINILYIGLGFLVFLIMGFRTLLAFTLLFTLFLLYSVTKNAIRIIGYLILGCILAFGVSQTEFAQSKIKEMQTRQEKGDNFSNKDYIRYREYEYFTEEQFIKPGEKFIGGGTPVYDGNNYANTLDHVAITYGYFWVDLGLIGLSWIIGIPAVLILIYIIIRCSIRIKDKDILFIRYTLLTTLFSSLLTTAEIFRRGNFIIIALFLCVEYTRSLEKKKHSLNNTYYDKKFGN